MNRRGFLQLLGAAGAMAVTGLSLDELLAPEKTIFLPPSIQIIEPTIEVVQPLSLFIPQLWSNEILAAYKSNLVFANLINRNYSQHARQRNTGSYHIFENRIRAYQGLHKGQ